MATSEPREVALNPEHTASRSGWQRSSRCEHANCVEVSLGRPVLVRDSALPDQPGLAFAPDEWRAFVAAVKIGLFGR